jgi:hypothetical protein
MKIMEELSEVVIAKIAINVVRRSGEETNSLKALSGSPPRSEVWSLSRMRPTAGGLMSSDQHIGQAKPTALHRHPFSNRRISTEYSP